MTFAPYSTCTYCSGKAQSGTAATMAYLLDKFTYSRSMGIYSCRRVAGSSTRSLHSCGRAGDSGVPTSGGAAITKYGNPIVQWLSTYSTQLGIEQIIYNRIVYDRKTPRGRYYGGVHPHRDHVHWGQSLSKARSVTYAYIVSFAGKPGGGGGSTPPPSGGSFTLQITRTMIKQGAKTPLGGDVAIAQGLLHAWGQGRGVGVVDGNFDSAMHREVVAFQKSKGLQADGIIGPNTWKALES